MHVKFDDGFVEFWFYGDQPTSKFYGRWYRIPDNVMYPFNKQWPEFRCQFSRTTDDPDFDLKGKFFLYTPKYLKKHMFCNVRVFLHRLANSLEKEGYIKQWLPQTEIDRVINKLNSADWAMHKINNKTYKIQPTTARIARPLILMQGLDLSQYWNRRSLFVALDLLHRKKWTMTRESLIWHMRKRRRVRYDTGHSMGLATILREYYPRRPIINHTGCGWVDIAALINGVPCLQNGDGVHISESPTGQRDEIILNSGDCKLIGPRPDNQDFIYVSISRQNGR